MGDRAKAASKSKGKVVAEKKMQPRSPKAADKKQQKQQQKQQQQLKQEQTAQEKAALLIQRATRGILVRKGFAGLLALEDHVLRVPTPARRAMDHLSREPEPGLQGDLGQLDEYLGIRTDETEGSEEGSLKASSSGLLSHSSKRPIRSGGRAPRRHSETQGHGNEQGVSEQMLRGHLEATLPDSKFSASKILWLFSTQHLGLSHFQSIYMHHDLRRKNVNRQVRLRLVVVQHGDSNSNGLVRGRAQPMDSAHGAAAGQKNLLAPEGWLQVTRTSWSLRLHAEFRPDLICSSTLPCCLETAGRIRTVLDDASGGEGEGRTAAGTGLGAGAPMPVSTHEALDPASLTGFGTPGPRLHRVAAALTAAVSSLPAPQASAEGLLPPPYVVLLVAGGTTLEALLACLCAGSAPAAASRSAAAAKAEASGEEAVQGAPPLPRLGGGDGVLLASPPLMRVRTARRKTRSRQRGRSGGREEETRQESRQRRGEAEEPDEVVRPMEELWRNALLRGQWSVCHHLRGHERLPAPQSERLGEEGLDQELGPSWRSYAGEPLVLSSAEFAQLCRRAGTSFMPVSPQATATLRPLVKDCS